jgi:hypothetical protein
MPLTRGKRCALVQRADQALRIHADALNDGVVQRYLGYGLALFVQHGHGFSQCIHKRLQRVIVTDTYQLHCGAASPQLSRLCSWLRYP